MSEYQLFYSIKKKFSQKSSCCVWGWWKCAFIEERLTADMAICCCLLVRMAYLCRQYCRLRRLNWLRLIFGLELDSNISTCLIWILRNLIKSLWRNWSNQICKWLKCSKLIKRDQKWSNLIEKVKIYLLFWYISTFLIKFDHFQSFYWH